jgi:hypothetical protein
MTSLILPNTIANGANADGDKLDQNLDVIVSWSNTEVVNRDGSVAMTGQLLLPGDPTQPNQAATKAYVDNAVSGGSLPSSGGDCPIGTMVMWHNNITPPLPWLDCQGQQVSRTTYAALFAVIGTRYGFGNGSTTFNIPQASVYLYNYIGYSKVMIKAY